MSLATLLALSLALEAPPTLHTMDLGDRIAVSGPAWAMQRLLEGRPALESERGEIALDLVEHATDGREPVVALYAPRAPLQTGRRYMLKSWPGTDFERRDAAGAPAPWNGTIEVLESGAGVRLRFTPLPAGPLVRVAAAGTLAFIPVEGSDVRLFDLPPGRVTVTAQVLGGAAGASAPRSFTVDAPRKIRHKGCRPGVVWRVASTPAPAPWSLWQRLLAFGALPFAAGYTVVALATRRRRVIRG